MRTTISIVLLVVFVFCAAAQPAASPGPQSNEASGPARAAEAEERVELNTADKPALEALPGIGPRTAELIIEYRTENGGFKKVEDLMNIRGIGERTFLRLRELVRVDGEMSQQ